jgi:hypothetical protein
MKKHILGYVLLLGLLISNPLRAFISPDPEGHVASMDLYAYCNGDPVNGYDPDGRVATEVGTKFKTATADYNRWNLQQIYQQLETGDQFNSTLFSGDYKQAAGIAGPVLASSLVSSISVEAKPVGAMAIGSFNLLKGLSGGFTKSGFSTAVNKAVFWSGREGANFTVATDFAVSTGRQTLEMTQGGKVLPAFTQSTRELWENASRSFAEEASGIVNAFTEGARPDSIWHAIEKPSLLLNPKVEKINLIDQLHPEKTHIIYPNRP